MILETGHRLPYFLKYSIESKKIFELDLKFPGCRIQSYRKVCKELVFSLKFYCAMQIFKLIAWLSNHMVCKIGLYVTFFGGTF